MLQYYVKYLKFCEKTANSKLYFSWKNFKKISELFSTKIDHQNNLSFSAQFGILCGKCLCLLLEKCSHFNYASNIISCLARLSLCKCKNVCLFFIVRFWDSVLSYISFASTPGNLLNTVSYVWWSCYPKPDSIQKIWCPETLRIFWNPYPQSGLIWKTKDGR